MKKRWSTEIKHEAESLRISGLSYGDIVKRIAVPRSTLFTWLMDTKNPKHITTEDKLLHLSNIRKLAALAHINNRQKRLDTITEKVNSEFSKLKVDDLLFLKYILSTLYWAEGSKTRGYVVFTNTDPKMSYLFLSLLRKCYPIDESKLRVRLHLHYYHNINEVKKYWSTLLRIPEYQFGKIYIKKRSKTKRFRKNFAGICFIKYYSEDLRFEILEVAKNLSQRLAPVA